MICIFPAIAADHENTFLNTGVFLSARIIEDGSAIPARRKNFATGYILSDQCKMEMKKRFALRQSA
jgi:hypothetical protein